MQLAVNITRESHGRTHFNRCWRSSCVLLITLATLLPATQGKDITVGGTAGWTHTASYTDLEAVVGDRLVSCQRRVHTFCFWLADPQ